MAATIIKLKNSSVASKSPLTSDLILGEIAINSYDGHIYLKKNDGVEAIVNATTDFVTYATLNTNGSVGTGATQVARGNHTHAYEPIDSTILREADVIDTLVSTSTVAPLSANMGKTLEDSKLNIIDAPVFGVDSVTARTLNSDLTLDGNGTGGVVVAGDLTVQGTFTTTISNEVEIGDSVIRLNALLDSGTAPTTDAGFQVERGSSADVALLWDETADKWTLTEDGTNFYNVLNSNDIGIANTNLVSIDDISVASGNFVRFTANGVEGLTQTEMRTALAVDASGTDNSTNVSLANTNYLSWQTTEAGQVLVGGTIPITSGGTGATDAATARSNLSVDVAGTDNSTNVTLSTISHDYLSIIGQEITLGEVDIIADTNLVAGTGIAFTTNTLNVQYGLTSTTALRGDSGINALSDVDTNTTAPQTNEVLTWNGTKWAPSATAATYSGWNISDGTNSENIASSNTLEFSSLTPNFVNVDYNTATNVMDISVNTGTTATTLAVGNHTHTLQALTDTTVTLAGDATDGGLILVYDDITDKWVSTDTLDGGSY